MPEPQPAFQFVDLRQQHDVAQLGMWVFLATEVLFFGGLILAYCVYRTGYPDGFAEAARHTKIVDRHGQHRSPADQELSGRLGGDRLRG